MPDNVVVGAWVLVVDSALVVEKVVGAVVVGVVDTVIVIVLLLALWLVLP